MIEFNIDDVTYYAKSDMTWEQWINSKYNYNNFVIDGSDIKEKIGDIFSLVQTNGQTTFVVYPYSRIISGDYIFSDQNPMWS